jgi:acetylglutamate/LysW-gamma-L-alpha-aminoadipate kinase
MSNKTYVVKLGGGEGNNPIPALHNLAVRVKNGERWILVHGCSAATNQLAEDLSYPPRTLTSPSGHSSRYTDSRTIQIFSMAAAAVNQNLTAQLCSYDITALGLAGPNIIRAERKKNVRAIVNGKQVIVRDDYTGKINGVNWGILSTLLQGGVTPVVAPLAMGDEYESLNVDGDLVAAHIAEALDADSLIILSNVPGLLQDVGRPDSLISEFRLAEMEHYEALAAGRMKKKLLAAQVANAPRCILADSRVDFPLDEALGGAGTHILK